MRNIYIIMVMSILVSCTPRQNVSVNLDQIDKEEETGNFAKASHLIDLYIADNKLSDDTIYELNLRKEIMRRIGLDFSVNKEQVMEYIQKYYPDVNDDMLSRWEDGGSLEYMIINGEKRYFKRGASNLFRLDKDAIERKRETDKPVEDAKEKVLKKHLPEIVSTLSKTRKTQMPPVAMKVKYEVTLKPNVVPAGETVRCWLPYPREDERRQTDVKLISVNEDNYIISPPQYAHRTIYMEKTARENEPLKFEIEFSYKSAAEWFNISDESAKPYDINSETFKTYTSERAPHVVFSDSIKAISERIVGNETNPWQKVKKIFTWIDSTFPWAGAREYSTIDNITKYVLTNRHGDCGQVTLLFITLARYNGIPARWQSGFMMHPGALNMHDWGEFYIEGVGWIPLDQSFGINMFTTDEKVMWLYSNGIDAYRWIVNNDYSRPLFPSKTYPRSETVDFQRGELEWKGGNIYYDKWNWDFDVSYLND